MGICERDREGVANDGPSRKARGKGKKGSLTMFISNVNDSADAQDDDIPIGERTHDICEDIHA
jgi:hypothetical protein